MPEYRRHETPTLGQIGVCTPEQQVRAIRTVVEHDTREGFKTDETRDLLVMLGLLEPPLKESRSADTVPVAKTTKPPEGAQRPRGQCPVCHSSVALLKDGTVYRHHFGVGVKSPICTGTKLPAVTT